MSCSSSGGVLSSSSLAMTFSASSVNLWRISEGEPYLVRPEALCKRINYLALVSDSKKTLENSARMIRADAEAGRMPS